MGSPDQGQAFFNRYGLDEVPQVSDPECRLYRAFGLRRGTLRTFLRWRTWVRAARIFPQYGVGLLAGDGLRMPGVFLLEQGEIIRAFRHESPEETPDFLALAERTVS